MTGLSRWVMCRHILVAFNGAAVATRALRAALGLARAPGGEVHVLCVAERSAAPPHDSGWELELKRHWRDQCRGGWLIRASALGRERVVPPPPSSPTPRVGGAIWWWSGAASAGAGSADSVGPPQSAAAPCPVLVVN